MNVLERIDQKLSMSIMWFCMIKSIKFIFLQQRTEKYKTFTQSSLIHDLICASEMTFESLTHEKILMFDIIFFDV